ncbi:uncharacterized protein BO88DRAFT_475283 [Aspergillus vadensis CBS 113365]|uniref:Uncharacterized protein n=1 Tax=Aspergillus vadensis (strain CBS 113365 / IMI 142717 / IBT 24658) TaxID=1448311 RepID=A0A319AUH4_ASPVC|nr:hypothetical protein BO88DRAFT_475283 [Aspergillus vadensis CBS 113365]PYH63996.1 hypothetical protein BO88DRAFT_475283 [Aspergillus vadensis CBS 113365]
MQLGVLYIMINYIFDRSNILSVHADTETVLALESQVLKLSEPDQEYLQSRMMDDQTLFLLIDDSDTRAALWKIFFQDLCFLDIINKVIKNLLLLPEDLDSKKIKKITINCKLTPVLFRIARLRFWLADQHGFRIPAIAEFMPGRATLPTPQTPEGLGSNEQDKAVNQRCGIPYADTVDADCFALEGGRLWQPWESPQVTAVFFRQSQFQTFFRYLWDRSGINQATNAEDESAASEEAAAVDPEIPDCDIEHPMPSPSLSQLPERSNSIDWFMEMWDCGLGGMAMPAGDLVVVLFHGLKMRKFSLHSTDHRNVTEEENLHVWHLRNPGQNVLASLTEENVQDYPTSDLNRLKRRRKGLSEAVSDIAAWVDEQIFRLSTHVLTCSSTAQEEEY